VIALDTNVIVRVITRDDPAQARRAAALLRREDLWLSKTVLLETAWVLRYTYELNRPEVHRALLTLVGLGNLTVEDRPAVETALHWHQAGMDFADALHLASSGPAARFATFDERMEKIASGLTGTPRIELLR
jgi:predicted nucleic-acid-binding protein